jgi:hypothetical protein
MTNLEYVQLALDELGHFEKPKTYRDWIRETHGIIVNPSDVTKVATSWTNRKHGIDKKVQDAAARYLNLAGSYQLALTCLKRAKPCQ